MLTYKYKCANGCCAQPTAKCWSIIQHIIHAELGLFRLTLQLTNNKVGESAAKQNNEKKEKKNE